MLVGNWSAETPSGFRNINYPEAPASFAYTFQAGFPFNPLAVGVAAFIYLAW